VVPPPPESFGSLLQRRRHTDDLTQTQLGLELGVSQQTIGAWERGDRPRNRSLDALAKYLGMDKQKLVSLIDGRPSSPSDEVRVDETAEESINETPGEPADGDHAMMRDLARSFIEAHRSGPVSPQDATAYDTLFKYFSRNRLSLPERRRLDP
jgi:transcriptional regulator with XRE-family HTH domain